MSDKWSKYPTPLIFRRDELLDYKSNVRRGIPNPVIAINDDHLVLGNASFMMRNLFLILALLGLLTLCAENVKNVYESWKHSEENTISYINSQIKKYGDDYVEVLSLGAKEVESNNYHYNRLNDDGKLSFEQFLTDRYGNFYQKGDEIRRSDRNKLLFFSITIPLLLIWILRFKKGAPLVFDRQRRVVYSWIEGVVAAQYYDSTLIHQGPSTLQVLLRGPIDDEHLGWARFSVLAGGNNAYSLIDAHECILSYIVKFMEQGREHVMPQKIAWSGRKGFSLYEDKKPADFEEQLALLLHRIDMAKDDLEYDQNGQLIEASNVVY